MYVVWTSYRRFSNFTRLKRVWLFFPRGLILFGYYNIAYRSELLVWILSKLNRSTGVLLSERSRLRLYTFLSSRALFPKTLRSRSLTQHLGSHIVGTGLLAGIAYVGGVGESRIRLRSKLDRSRSRFLGWICRVYPFNIESE